MIVSHRHRFIFVEVPLAAGDKLREYLLAQLGDEDLAVEDAPGTDDSSPAPLRRYSTAREIRRELDAAAWNDYLKFAFVRNPWEACVAQFLAAKSRAGDAANGSAAGTDPADEFEDFLLAPERSLHGFADFLDDDGGAPLLDFVGRYESLQRDLGQLAGRLGLPEPDQQSYRLQPLADYARYYNALTRDLVASAYETDIERFGYSFAEPGSGSAIGPRRRPGHLIAHFGHHKAGTVWFQRVLKRLAERLDWNFQSCLQQDLEADTQIYMQENSRVELQRLPEFRGSHIVRDPRDLVVSGYFYHLWCEEPWCLEKREKFGGRSYQEALGALPPEQGIEMEIERCRSTFSRMLQWNYQDPRLFEVRFEDLLEDQYAVFEAVFEHYGLSRKQIEVGLAEVEQSDFERMTGRKKGQEAPDKHLRKGIAGDWKNHFTQAHRDRFKSLYPGLLASLGYEADDDW